MMLDAFRIEIFPLALKKGAGRPSVLARVDEVSDHPQLKILTSEISNSTFTSKSWQNILLNKIR